VQVIHQRGDTADFPNGQSAAMARRAIGLIGRAVDIAVAYRKKFEENRIDADSLG